MAEPQTPRSLPRQRAIRGAARAGSSVDASHLSRPTSATPSSAKPSKRFDRAFLSAELVATHKEVVALKAELKQRADVGLTLRDPTRVAKAGEEGE